MRAPSALSRTLAVLSLALPLCAGAVTVRDALLCEARLRLDTWFADKSRLESPNHRDGVTIYQTKEGTQCGGDSVPVTFGEFDIEGVRLVDALNSLSDTLHEKDWDPLVSSVSALGDVPQQLARQVSISFNAHPFSDRETYEWQVFEASDPRALSQSQEFWIVHSTEESAPLYQQKPKQSGAVQAQNCLGTYHIAGNGRGGVHVRFTSQVNAHPFLLSNSFIQKLTWGKTVDFINSLRQRAQALARAGGDGAPVVPAWLFAAAPPPPVSTGAAATAIPFADCAVAVKAATEGAAEHPSARLTRVLNARAAAIPAVGRLRATPAWWSPLTGGLFAVGLSSFLVAWGVRRARQPQGGASRELLREVADEGSSSESGEA